jgi:hypothetical protein
MFRLLKLVLLLLVIGVVAVVAFGYGWRSGEGSSESVGTTGSRIDDARQAGVEIAGRVADGATKAEAVLAEARLTTKIKSKIALDDTLDGSRVTVDTTGTVVTIKGSVASSAQRTRALQLARETDGVTSVVDRLEVGGR